MKKLNPLGCIDFDESISYIRQTTGYDVMMSVLPMNIWVIIVLVSKDELRMGLVYCHNTCKLGFSAICDSRAKTKKVTADKIKKFAGKYLGGSDWA